MISINNNMGGMRAMDGLQQSHLQLQVSLERLSTGVRINRAEDDAAGLMQRDRFNAQVNGLTEAIRNIQTGMGMVQVAEQGLNKVTEALQQMRSLAVRAADDNLTDSDRANLQNQVKGLLLEINSRSQTTVYNGHKLLDGSITDSVAERQGRSRIQTNAFLADGADLIRGTATTGTAATTANAISQGSYEVKLVFSGQKGVLPQETTTTQLAGIIDSPSAAPSTTNLNQIITDRNGGAHTASFTFTELSAGNRNYTYSVTVPAGGVYPTAQTFSGTMSFNADGSIATVDGHPPGALQRAVTLPDGTTSGQPWTIDFSKLQENQHATAGPAATATQNGGPVGSATATVVASGNLDDGAAPFTPASTTLTYFDSLGAARTVDLVFTKTVDGGVGADTYSITTANPSNGTSAAITAGGSITAVAGSFAATGPATLQITDSYGVVQTISVAVATMTNNPGLSNPSVVPGGGTPGAAAAGTPSTTFNVGGPGANHLSSTHLVSDSVTTTPQQLFDRTGASHSTSVTYAKLSSDASGETWTYSVNGLSGGAWTGANSGNVSGTLHFTTGGVLDAVNGGPGTTASLIIGDGTATGQPLGINFLGLNTTGAAADNVAQVPTGAAGTPTTSIQLADNLISGSGSTPGTADVQLRLFDRTGLNVVEGVRGGAGPRITFSQVAGSNTWNYTVTAPTSSGFTGFGSGLQGQVQFNAAGNVTLVDGQTALSKSVNFADGTPEGQSINIDFGNLNMAHATDLTTSSTNGGAGTQVGEVSAAIFYSDGTNTNGAAAPISTLVGIDLSAKSFSAGGISFTVEQASTLDVGLTSYVKAYTYVSAVQADRALSFQVGSDEGQTLHVGIAKMDIYSLFRADSNTGGEYTPLDVNLDNTLKAQDLIGQIDDAINYVGAQNLKVGQFQNSFARTLEVQRQNLTSISGALSNINDADMAVEATNQSKRSILVQSGTAMVAQANTQGQFLLQLLR